MVKKSSGKALHAIPIKSSKPYSKKIAKMEAGKNKQKVTSKKSLKNFQVSKIKCKAKRLDVFFRRKKEMQKLKKISREHELTGKPKLMPLTIEDQREVDENFVYDAEENEDIQKEQDMDEFSKYFQEGYEPKIMLTTSEKPSGKMFDFLKEMKDVFSQAHYWPRKQFSLQEIQQYALSKEYTDILVFREDKKQVTELIMIHLPDGPNIQFKITNITMSDKIHHSGRVTDHNPELILNNFNTHVGRRVGRFFASLFPQKPDFRGRRVVTFHNQRDFIFFRHHRYIFQDEGERVALQEIGPRLTLKVKKIQLGLFNNTSGEIEFEAKDKMYVSRKRVFI